jgi:hypothetical protein
MQHQTARHLRQAVIERDVAGDRRCAARIKCVICSDEEGFRTLVEPFHPASRGEVNTEAGCKENPHPDWVSSV